jgi:RecJ-like exonuclease
MICPECSGVRRISLIKPDVWEAAFDTFAGEITCPTCEGDGELPDTPIAKHCLACGEPIADDQDWCDEHKGAAFVNEGLG